MDKRLILAVAGSGKTTHIVERLNSSKRSLIITYTTGNYNNLKNKIVQKFDSVWPENITLMTYFSFLFSFCYKPLLADIVRSRGIIYEPNPNKFVKKENIRFYMTNERYFYSNRLSFSFEFFDVLEEIQSRIEHYFDELVIDEVQDISGRDFNFLQHIMETKINMLFVGDFYQHTYDTSKDGNVNINLFNDYATYKDKFLKKGFIVDENTLKKSWRCNEMICSFVRENLGIEIYSHNEENPSFALSYLKDQVEIARIMRDSNIVKLHYENSSKYGSGHKNWGETKGEDCYHDICIILNKKTDRYYKEGTLVKLAPQTKNKLYVALTRARGNVYFVDSLDFNKQF